MSLTIKNRKVWKTGNSYGIRINKLFVDNKIVKIGEELEFELPLDFREKDAVLRMLDRDFPINRNLSEYY